MTDGVTPPASSGNTAVSDSVRRRQTVSVLRTSERRGGNTPDAVRTPQRDTTTAGFFDHMRPDWFTDAACRGKGVADWFDPVGVGASRARQVCHQCPVRSDCLDFALADPSLHGVWGGLNARERGQLRRTRRLAS